jgi:hypothetical protein
MIYEVERSNNLYRHSVSVFPEEIVKDLATSSTQSSILVSLSFITDLNDSLGALDRKHHRWPFAAIKKGKS